MSESAHDVPVGQVPESGRRNADSRDVVHSSHWGAFLATVRDGRVEQTRPFPEDEDPSPIVSGIADGIGSTARVRQPAVRRGWLEQGPGVTSDRRGADEFVTVDWDTALRLVAGELARVRDGYGNEAIFGGSYGWASAGRFHHAKSQLTRFLNCFGGFTGQIGNYSFAASDAILPYVVGSKAMGSGDTTSWDVIAEHTDLWVMFGGVPMKNTQVESGGVVSHTARGRLADAKARGTRFVAITPVRDDAPDFLDATWIAPRPNTDTALMLGLAHTLLQRGWHDEDFLARHCAGWPVFREYLLGHEDGTVKTADWASAITGVPAGQITMLAQEMARSRTLVSSTWSLQRADHGEQPFWMLVTLASMLGQIGLPGGGFGFAYGSESGIGTVPYPFPAPALPVGRNPLTTAIPVARLSDMLLRPGEDYQFNGERRRYPHIRMIYWAGGNPFHHHQDINRLLAAWRRPETVVVHEIWWTATARHADIVLPATTTLERNDLGAAARDSYLVAMKKAVDPVGGARNDHDILADLAGRLGFREQFTAGRDEAKWLQALYGQAREAGRRHDIDLPGFDTFWTDGVAHVWTGKQKVLLEDFRNDPGRHPLSTPSGRIEIFSATIDGFGYPDCPGHPVWLEPAEWLGSELARRFPLHLISNQPATRLHSQLDMGRVSRDSKIRGREPCRMNSVDAAARSIHDGDVVRIFNDRGACLAGVRVSDAIRPGVLQLSTGAWYAPAQPGVIGSLDAHGNPNVLTADHGTSTLGQGPSAHSALVEVERYAGPLPEVTIFTAPALP
jgi:biotin/methionine sulfoxide reductase